jgi:hypothetical protein
MDASNKNSALRFFSLAAAAAIAIALGLPSLRFAPGAPLPQASSEGTRLTLHAQGGIVSVEVNKLILTIFLCLLSAFILFAAARKLAGLNWKSILAFLAKATTAAAGMALFLFLMLNAFPRDELPSSRGNLRSPPQPPPVAGGGLPTEAPAALVWIAAGATVALALALCLRLLRGKEGSRRSADRLAMEAQSARLAILRGEGFKDVILQCYERMSLAMEKERGIEREDSMTAREFEELLIERGVPGESVRKLTSLFEMARYGDGEPSPEEEREAIGCLEAIERDAREGARP